MLVEGIDSSYDTLTESKATALRQAGIAVFGQCLWTGAGQPAPRVINLRVARRAGLTIFGYLSLTSAEGGAEHVTEARAGVPDDLWDALDFVAVDVELPGIEAGSIRDAIAALGRFGKSKPVIYTSANAWRTLVIPPNASGFADCYLWDADWRARPPATPDEFFWDSPYGDFRPERVIGVQYTGGQLVEGQFADRNVFVKEFFSMPAQPDQTKAALDSLYGALIALRQDHDSLVRDVRNVFAYALEHARDDTLHGGYAGAGVYIKMQNRIEDAVEALDRRIAEQNQRLAEAGRLLAGDERF